MTQARPSAETGSSAPRANKRGGAETASGGESDSADESSPEALAPKPLAPKPLAPETCAATLRGHVYLVGVGQEETDALARELAQFGFLVRDFASADAFLASLLLLAAGCIVTRVSSAPAPDVGLQHDLRVRGCGFPVVSIVAPYDVLAAVRTMKAGAADVVIGPVSAAELCVAVQGALAQLSPAALDTTTARAMRDRLARLTGREIQVLEALLQGAASKAIAGRLGISPRTVEVHRAKVMGKLGCRSPPDVVRFAIQAGMPVVWQAETQKNVKT